MIYKNDPKKEKEILKQENERLKEENNKIAVESSRVRSRIKLRFCWKSLIMMRN